MSEFKIVGNQYVSEWNGNSANPGTDVSPFAHPNDLTSSTTNIGIIGSGYYQMTSNMTKAVRMFGDGIVKLDFNNSFSTFSGLNFNGSFVNPNFKDLIFDRGIVFFGSQQNAGHSHTVNCILDFTSINTQANSNGQASFYSCLIYNSRGSQITAASTIRHIVNLYASIVLSDLIGYTQFPLIAGLYLPKGVALKFNFPASSLSTLTATQIRTSLQDSMINGTFEFTDGIYESKQLFGGATRPDANPTYLDFASIGVNWSAFYTTAGNFAGDPKIIDIQNRIVQPDSDLLRRSGSFGFIGGVKQGFEVKKGDSGSNIEITTSQINTSNPDSWVIDSPTFNEGFIDFIVKIADTIVQCPRIHFDSLLAFRGNQAGGSVQNNNVPDFFPATYSPLSQAGLKPNRLSYKLRTSQSILKPTSDAEWDNDSATLGTTPGVFYDQEASAQPTINVIGGVRYGNANPAGLGGTINTINARWVHVRVRLTNQRTI